VPTFKAGTQEWSKQTRIRNAAKRAPEVYPGPVGELLAHELDAWAELAFLWVDGRSGRRMAAVVEDVLRPR